MATIVSSETRYKQVRGNTTRYGFRYTLDNGEVHDRIAWVESSVDEAVERDARGQMMLDELAQAEISGVLG
jgi:hypothetical protein